MTQLRNLPPANAWNEAERRAIPLAVLGFFIGGMLATFLDPSPRSDHVVLVWAICGAAGAFLVSLALFLGHYKQRWPLFGLVGVMSLVGLFVLSFVVTNSALYRSSVLRLLTLLLVASLPFYVGLHWLHIRSSSVSVREYLSQFGADDQGAPHSSMAKTLFWMCLAIGVIVVFALIRN